MADFSDGIRLLTLLAANDWYGLSAKEIGECFEWNEQKVARVIKDVERENLIHCVPNKTYRLHESFLGFLTKCQASYLDRLNLISSRPDIPVRRMDGLGPLPIPKNPGPAFRSDRPGSAMQDMKDSGCEIWGMVDMPPAPGKPCAASPCDNSGCGEEETSACAEDQE